MNKSVAIDFEFVDFIPDSLSQNTLYISIEHGTAVHKCMCGCGVEVVTPLTPTDWKLIYDGETVSLYPSIGNWSFPCQSHYWIERSRVYGAEKMTQEEIDAIRSQDRFAKWRRYERE